MNQALLDNTRGDIPPVVASTYTEPAILLMLMEMEMELGPWDAYGRSGCNPQNPCPLSLPVWPFAIPLNNSYTASTSGLRSRLETQASQLGIQYFIIFIIITFMAVKSLSTEKCLLPASDCAGYFIYFISFSPHNNPFRQGDLTSFYR